MILNFLARNITGIETSITYEFSSCNLKLNYVEDVLVY